MKGFNPWINPRIFRPLQHLLQALVLILLLLGCSKTSFYKKPELEDQRLKNIKTYKVFYLHEDFIDGRYDRLGLKPYYTKALYQRLKERFQGRVVYHAAGEAFKPAHGKSIILVSASLWSGMETARGRKKKKITHHIRTPIWTKSWDVLEDRRWEGLTQLAIGQTLFLDVGESPGLIAGMIADHAHDEVSFGGGSNNQGLDRLQGLIFGKSKNSLSTPKGLLYGKTDEMLRLESKTQNGQNLVLDRAYADISRKLDVTSPPNLKALAQALVNAQIP